MSIAEKIAQIAQNEQKVYDAGKKAVFDDFYDLFWDAYQQASTDEESGEMVANRTNYQSTFSGAMWTDDSFKPKYKIIPTSVHAYRIFEYSALKKPDLSMVDFSLCGGLVRLFAGSQIEELGVLNFSSTGPNWGGINQTFHNCQRLKRVEKIILPNTPAPFQSSFVECVALEEIDFDGVIGMSIDFGYSPLLSATSIRNIFEHLVDAADASTLTLSETAVNNAFTSTEWSELISNMPANWTVLLKSGS